MLLNHSHFMASSLSIATSGYLSSTMSQIRVPELQWHVISVIISNPHSRKPFAIVAFSA
jgi:hypothetical protein